MIVTTNLIWQSVNWPSSAAAIQYAIFVGSNSTPAYTTTNSATETTVSYDDALPGTVFVIRPTDGTNYGPSQTVVIANSPLNNRAWVRSYLRKKISDRVDQTAGQIPTVTDDELNDYINDALRNYSLQFPVEKDYTITLVAGGELAGARDYALPTDFQKMVQVRYNQANSHLQMYLKEASFKGGETTATSWVGYPKLGILQPPIGGRYYPGHYDIYENAIHIDFDPLGNGDTLSLRYEGSYAYPLDDLTTLPTPETDLEMICLYAEAKTWLEIEAKDVLLSRWPDANHKGRRDDMPTERYSTRLFNAWQQLVKDRRTLRPRQFRLERR